MKFEILVSNELKFWLRNALIGPNHFASESRGRQLELKKYTIGTQGRRSLEWAKHLI